MKKPNYYINEKLRISSKHNYKQYQPQNVKELRDILEMRLKDDKNANLNDIDVSDITDMHAIVKDSKGLEKHGLFYELDPHNIDISQWDVSKVTDMAYMFYGCGNFNCDLSHWDVSKVNNMKFMFYHCYNFDSDLSNWDANNVVEKYGVFIGCESLINKPSWY